MKRTKITKHDSMEILTAIPLGIAAIGFIWLLPPSLAVLNVIVIIYIAQLRGTTWQRKTRKNQ